MKYAALFLWLALPISAALIFATQGAPHVIWRYSFHSADRYGPFADRTYTSCTYWGWHGQITAPAQNGRCKWVRLFPAGNTH